jgi:hypothetical protein
MVGSESNREQMFWHYRSVINYYLTGHPTEIKVMPTHSRIAILVRSGLQTKKDVAVIALFEQTLNFPR